MDDADFARVIDRCTFDYVRVFPHPIARVWRAITDEAEVSQWFWTAAFEPRLGAPFRFGPDEGGIKGVILAFEPPRLIRFSDPPAGGEGYFEFRLASVAGGTRVTLVQHGTPSGVRVDWPSPGLLAGWHLNIDNLGVFIDGGVCQGSRAREDALAEIYRERGLFASQGGM
ncbi:MAG TPA: SRPBCC domain-containing protein [Caulobacteraceae bacterium]|jgi:uncharacterized protein YndB with AHSA1/START domain